MASEKYVIATADNPFHILLRNSLDPFGYFFMECCSDSGSLIRTIRSFSPDFVLADTTINIGRLRLVADTVDDEMLCAFIILGEQRNSEIQSLIENSRLVSFCRKPVNLELLAVTVEAALQNLNIVRNISRKQNEINEQIESKQNIDSAKAILINTQKLTESEAYNRIRARSMQQRIPMKEVAENIISMNKMKREKKTDIIST